MNRLRGPRALAVLMTVALCCAGSAQASVAASSSGVSRVAHLNRDAARRVLRYWTPARMRTAQPIDGHSSPGAAPPAPEASASARVVSGPTVYPYSTAGRIFLRTRHARAYCSGVAVNTATRRVVLTAGHCLSVREGTAVNPETTRYLEFVPSYTNGLAPFGKFVMEAGFVLEAWKRTENPNDDIGVVLTYPNALGQNVADATGGGANLAVNLPRQQEFTIVGYPGFNQQRMRTCSGGFSGHNPFSQGFSGMPQSLASCYLMPGSSGGPWFVGEPPVLDGLTSETVQLRPFEHFLSSPYFGSANVVRLLEGL